jgi:hypothetical protein
MAANRVNEPGYASHSDWVSRNCEPSTSPKQPVKRARLHSLFTPTDPETNESTAPNPARISPIESVNCSVEAIRGLSTDPETREFVRQRANVTAEEIRRLQQLSQTSVPPALPVTDFAVTYHVSLDSIAPSLSSPLRVSATSPSDDDAGDFYKWIPEDDDEI